jgi:hypothetical protein
VSALLALAETQLQVSGSHSNRIACWLARSALEETLDRLLSEAGISCGDRASARSKLSCLEVEYGNTDLPARAQYAWSRLSEACHHHAYELSPTHSEAQHLVELVHDLDATVAV